MFFSGGSDTATCGTLARNGGAVAREHYLLSQYAQVYGAKVGAPHTIISKILCRSPWSEGGRCTDENAVFRCDSDKNSLVMIRLYLKVHSLKIC